VRHLVTNPLTAEQIGYLAEICSAVLGHLQAGLSMM
jgi:hypothetical protein